MRRLSQLVFALWALSLSGCIFQNVSAEERLRDAVVGYNQETRWNRIDLAQQRVAPAIRGEFRMRHHRWGRRIRVADLDILDVSVRGDEREVATAIVEIRWYDERTMIIADTIVAQDWERVPGGYLLIAETVREGDPELLEIPPELLAAQEEAEEAAREAAEAAERGDDADADASVDEEDADDEEGEPEWNEPPAQHAAR